MHPSLLAGSLLRLRLDNPNESEPTRFNSPQPDRILLDDLIPDHSHLMHLFVVRMPEMKAFWHLHPDQTRPGDFAQNLPIMPEGQYKLFADIVHHTGFPETEVATVNLPSVAGTSMSGDDAGSFELAPADKIAQLSGGYHMVWQRDDRPFQANQPYWFRFRIEDQNGKPASDLEPYMGMAGHAVFLSVDGSIFAHVHPAGSVSMAAVGLAEGGGAGPSMAKWTMARPPLKYPFLTAFPNPANIASLCRSSERVRWRLLSSSLTCSKYKIETALCNRPRPGVEFSRNVPLLPRLHLTVVRQTSGRTFIFFQFN